MTAIETLVVERALLRAEVLFEKSCPTAKFAIAWWLGCVASRCRAAGVTRFDEQVRALRDKIEVWATSSSSPIDVGDFASYVKAVGWHIGLIGAEQLGGEGGGR